MAFFEGFIQKFMPYLADLAIAQGSSDLEYTDVHGVCDIAHTDGLFQALSFEMALNPLGPEANIFEGVDLLQALVNRIVYGTKRPLQPEGRYGAGQQTERLQYRSLGERAGYFEVPGAHLYTVLHHVDQPVARVLLVGPFASERHSSYIPWVYWARYLAAKGIEVLRYDYRGIGESDGVFEEMSFAPLESGRSSPGRLAERPVAGSAHSCSMVLGWGRSWLRLAFHSGLGEVAATLVAAGKCEPGASIGTRAMDKRGAAFKYGDERKPPSAFIQDLERGSPVEVEGYQWSGKLWQDSFHVRSTCGIARGKYGSRRV